MTNPINENYRPYYFNHEKLDNYSDCSLTNWILDHYQHYDSIFNNTFYCDICKRLRHENLGCADYYPNVCDYCWEKIND